MNIHYDEVESPLALHNFMSLYTTQIIVNSLALIRSKQVTSHYHDMWHTSEKASTEPKASCFIFIDYAETCVTVFDITWNCYDLQNVDNQIYH